MRQMNLFVCDLESAQLFSDIIILSEIWINKSELASFKIEGYNTFSRCNEGYRAGVVVIYIKHCYHCCGVRERETMYSHLTSYS